MLPLASVGGAISEVLLGFTIILVAAKLGGELFIRLRMPAVLGELIAGILLGNVVLGGWQGLEFLKTQPVLLALAEIGVILLLFEVGIESTVPQMLKVGGVALGVAFAGVVAPALLGVAVAWVFFPAAPFYVHLFIGTVLCATSVGITARVLQEMGKTATGESKIILGAAVIDDILGLLVLATVSGMILASARGEGINPLAIAWIAGKALLFLVTAILAGLWVAPRMYRIAGKLRSRGLLLATSLAFCFFLAYLSEVAGLAPIVGAFTAGLILEDVHFKDLETKEARHLGSLLEPVVGILLPVFFVLVGLRVDVRAFLNGSVLGFAAVLTAAAVLGKLACAIPARGVDRWAVALGMIPRGEVGLIFAGIGTTLVLKERAVITPPMFSACVIMVLLTTLITPPLLKWRMGRIST